MTKTHRLLSPAVTDAIETLRGEMPHLIDALRLSNSIDISSWLNIIAGKLIPRFSPDFPLMAAICGGGSSGKSTLFNALVGERISPSGGSAGINRRILVSAPGEIFHQREFLSTLFAPFGDGSEPLSNPRDLTEPGQPLYILDGNVPRNMVLMDTPDFDTGARGGYTNRESVRRALEAADVLIYIFTNATYNNQDNTDFIARMLTGIGVRKCFLVYRTYASFGDDEVVRHANVVARHIYGESAEDHVLGIYRADEDNAVAAGEAFMTLRPARPTDPPFMDALKALDPRTLRPELLASILTDVVDGAENYLDEARRSRDALRLYLDALLATQSSAVRQSLAHFPMDQVLNRFAEIWMASDPTHIRAMRRTGKVIGTPVRVLAGAARWVSGRVTGGSRPNGETSFRDHLEADLLAGVNGLHGWAVSADLSAVVTRNDPVADRMKETADRLSETPPPGIDPPSVTTLGRDADAALTFHVAAHPAVEASRRHLADRNWKASIDAIMAQKDSILKLSEDIETELYVMADHFRGRMGLSSRIKQTFSAFLNVLPATVAITYILATGDPVGGAGIKVKLTGLFGLQDLYALVAIPATTGLNKADRQRLEALLGPIAKAWLENKMTVVQELFEAEITGDLIAASQSAISEADARIERIEAAVQTCKQAMPKR